MWLCWRKRTGPRGPTSHDWQPRYSQPTGMMVMRNMSIVKSSMDLFLNILHAPCTDFKEMAKDHWASWLCSLALVFHITLWKKASNFPELILDDFLFTCSLNLECLCYSFNKTKPRK